MFTDLPAYMVVAFTLSTLLELLVSLISTAVFLRASKLGGFQFFYIKLSDSSISVSACKAKLNKEPLDLFTVSSKYHNFANIFSESQANTLTCYYLYNLKIYLDEGTSPPWGPIYSLSQVEIHTLHKFINENVKTSFILFTLCIEYLSYLFIRKIVLSNYVKNHCNGRIDQSQITQVTRTQVRKLVYCQNIS